MPSYTLEVPIRGTQTIAIEADSVADAVARYNAGEGDGVDFRVEWSGRATTSRCWRDKPVKPDPKRGNVIFSIPPGPDYVPETES